jgi:hypothetical protein
MYPALLLLVLACALLKEHWPRAVGSDCPVPQSQPRERPEQDEYG